MNKLAEKIVSAMNEEELQQLVDDHYASESQTLTTGAEQNLLKLAELRGRMTDEQRARWKEIKEAFVRTRRAGGKGDDPVARVTGALGGLDEALQRIQAAIGAAVQRTRPRRCEAKRRRAAPTSRSARISRSSRSRSAPSASRRRSSSASTTARPRRPSSVVNIVREQSKMIERVIANLAELAKNGAPAVRAQGSVAPPRPVSARRSSPESRRRSPHARRCPRGSLPPVPQAPPGAQFGERIEELVAVVRRLEHRLATLGGGGSFRASTSRSARRARATSIAGIDGDDVVMHGGVFVATYAKLPPIGAAVILGIELPGGNRFEVAGTVAWTQDELGEDSPAGFGARIASAPEDARAMIAQFVRHREPLVRD